MIFSISASRISRICCADAVLEVIAASISTAATSREEVRLLTFKISPGFFIGNSGNPLFQRVKPRISTIALAAGLLLAGCAVEKADGFTPVSGFAGVVAGDEPRAVVVGRDIIGLGGSAVDAAVAMYFTMAVTMPSRASLGGGGVCVTFDAGRMQGEAIEFLPRAASSGGIVPSGMRAMAVLHARYGTLRWEQLLAPAETLARFGHAVSRAFSRDLAAEAELIAANPELMRLFSARSGRLARTGDRIIQLELSAVLGGIRQRGNLQALLTRDHRRFVEAHSSGESAPGLLFVPMYRKTVRIRSTLSTGLVRKSSQPA